MNRDLLVTYLESLGTLDSRYSELECVNYKVGSPDKKGVFSLVFKARDVSRNTLVALKFFDPEKMGDPYRLLSFEREPVILDRLVSKRRCLQLVKPMQTHNWQYDPTLSIPTKYFAVDWLEGEVDEVFQQQELYDAIDKLRLFIDITSAIEALHRAQVFHRDIKPDNLRYLIDNGRRIVVVIDMGTAARLDTPPLLSEYQYAVGLPLYSAPEACCGLAGDRSVAGLTDVYALGCLLYELFNKDLFGALMWRNPKYRSVLAAISIDLMSKSAADRIKAWQLNAKRFRNAVPPPAIDGPGTSVPPAVAAILADLLQRLVKFDFSERMTDFQWIRDRAMRAIDVLSNERFQQRILEQRKIARQNRLAKLKRRRQIAQRNS